MAKLRQIAFYGKGGIGKSTTSQFPRQMKTAIISEARVNSCIMMVAHNTFHEEQT